MSHYTEIKLKVKNRESILAAMELCGFERSQIEVHDKPVLLADYEGNRSYYRWKDHQDVRFKDGDCAHIVVRREHMGQSQNDFGIYLDGDESVVFLCDFSRSCDPKYCRNPVAKEEGNYSGWLNRFGTEYAAQETIQFHAARGEYAERVVAEDGEVYVYANAS